MLQVRLVKLEERGRQEVRVVQAPRVRLEALDLLGRPELLAPLEPLETQEQLAELVRQEIQALQGRLHRGMDCSKDKNSRHQDRTPSTSPRESLPSG